MATDKLCTATIGDLGNGSARQVIDEQLTRAVADTIARGTDGKPRRVTIQVEIELVEEGQLIARAFAQFKPPPFYAGASRGDAAERKNEPPAMLFELAENEEAA